LTAAQPASAPAATDAAGTPAESTPAAASPATALISGNAALTSDLLSVLLNEQSGASSGGGTTLAGILDQQDVIDQNGTGGAAQAQNDTQPDLLNVLDPTSAAQSATSTDSVLSGLQDLLAQLSV
jgi:hypothetical protein